MEQRLKQTTIRIDQGILDLLQEQGKKRRWSVSETIRAAADYWLEHEAIKPVGGRK